MKAPFPQDSHSKKICPNCGFPADHNYCAQCGQQTHLHDESFWAMILHFIGHYFHYDSKFWKTLKTLWFKPGELTLAYLRKERMRYIPPISLYIFISAVYFLVAFSSPGVNPARSSVHELRSGLDNIDNQEVATIPGGKLTIDTTSNAAIKTYFEKKLEKIKSEHGEGAGKYLAEKIMHNFPKVFFFLIPILAFFMKVLFLRRKSALFVHHAVFSLHIHAFFFSIFLIQYLIPFQSLAAILGLVLFLTGVIYFIIGMRKVYAIGYGRAILNTFLIGFGYFVAFTIAMAAIALLAFTS